MKKQDKLTTSIASLAVGGDGVSRDFDIPIFISRTAPGDTVDVELFFVRKDFAKGQATKIVSPSEHRVEPPCKIFKVCGGCQWQHLSYDYQAEAKSDIVKQAIEHIAHLNPSIVEPTIKAENPWHYRNKVQFPTKNPKNSKRMLAGYFQTNSHELVNVKHCPIQPSSIDTLMALVKELCEQYNISAYDENKHSGLLRHIAARYSFAHDQILLTFVINEDNSKNKDSIKRLTSIAKVIMEKINEVIGVCVNFNSYKGYRIYGDNTELLLGQAYLNETLVSKHPAASDKLKEGITFKLSSTSFFQVNSNQAITLLDEILQATIEINSSPNLILDAYAGVGTIALWLAPICQKIIAIEEAKSAIKDGIENLKLNKINNVEFHEDKVENVIPKLVKQKIKPEIIILDPPRQGVSANVIESIIALNADRIIYVSCNPATLARDLKIIEKFGYKTKRVRPIDMFPQTYHVESVTILDKQK
jgi:23S rRNA (uracil1939-C5)-methyltransferase